MSTWYKTVNEIYGPLIVVGGITNPIFDEIVEIKLRNTQQLLKGVILEAYHDKAIIQVLGSTEGLQTKNTLVRFTGEVLKVGVSEDVLGRVFDGTGELLDKGPEIYYEKRMPIGGAAINPYQRVFPQQFIQTGISTIDGLNSLARGQKLPIFSGAGLPHARLAAQIAKQAKVLDDAKAKFAIVFCAIGVTYDESQYFIKEFTDSGALQRSVLYINLASDPVVERISLPKVALTTAEYLAFEKDTHVLVIMTDMTNYCNALREVSAARKEVPGRMGYPGYMYTDLAGIYERTGIVKGAKGSITQIPILTMPSDDKTHPIPDLTGYITEGQIVLSRELHREGIYPPVDILQSLSRLKDKCIGEDKTRADHSGVLNQLFVAYAKGKELVELAKVLGESSLGELDRKYLQFLEEFNRQFIAQGPQENRSIIKTLEIGWQNLSIFPKRELKRIKDQFIEKYYTGDSV